MAFFLVWPALAAPGGPLAAWAGEGSLQCSACTTISERLSEALDFKLEQVSRARAEEPKLN